MGKKQTSQSKAAVPAGEETADTGGAANGSVLAFLPGGGDSATAVDPMLASLFEKSAGPVKAPQFTSANLAASSMDGGRSRGRTSEQNAMQSYSSDEDEAAEGASSESSDEEMEDADEESLTPDKGRKRKRGDADDVEGSYMRRMAKEEAKEDEKRRSEKAKRRKVVEAMGKESDSSDSESNDEENEDGIDSPPPLHESLSNNPDTALLDKSARTVFLSNVSTEAIKSKSAKKTLLKHLSSFFPSLPESATPHKIESIRFRSTAFASLAMPKRAAYAKRELMDSTTRSTNAYAVYTTTAAARQAPKALNGSVVLDRHLRVDSVAHPAPIDYKRCIFVGNLGFVDEETPTDEKGEQQLQKKKNRNTPRADVEEGLWRTFNEHARASIAKASKSAASKDDNTSSALLGPVESVRVIRDPATRIGKGIAYVQFRDENAVEAALLMDGQKFPPLLPRKLRVTRAKRVMKGDKDRGSGSGAGKYGKKTESRNANRTALGVRSGGGAGGERQSSFQGRATGLLGKAGAFKARNPGSGSGSKGDGGRDNESRGVEGSDPVVFEGFRARPDKGTGFKVKTKSRGTKGRGGKPKTRSTRRAAAFRAGGGMKKGAA
ncbi:nucleolar protein 12 [Blastomyces parvus]|uniref:Nucleolar protein 12 n=1 Tax=Blastomyces parvus TaxID=2060905 RepID=A0A2B7WUY8_9EURO|nr:nucleolar protein 12 [Blastomyces parvus]